MGKRIIQQARGKGSLTYRVRKKAFTKKVGYPSFSGEGEIIAIEKSAAHSAPLMKVRFEKGTFYDPAFNGAFVGQKISIGEKSGEGDISKLKDIPLRKKIFNIERNPGDGGKMIRTAGSSAVVAKKLENNRVVILMPRRKEVVLNENCRATIGVIAGDGRLNKPFLKAGKKYYKMKAKNKLWPRTSAVAGNAVDHPFGSGRGKKVKSKIVKRNASPGRKVGHLRPRRTGKKK